MKKIVLLGMFVFGFAFAASAQTDKPAAEQKTKACCKSKTAGESKECNKGEATAEAKACCKSSNDSLETGALAVVALTSSNLMRKFSIHCL
jgi:hypothetical protein